MTESQRPKVITLRLDDELREWLSERATRYRRSLSQEVIFLLLTVKTSKPAGEKECGE